MVFYLLNNAATFVQRNVNTVPEFTAFLHITEFDQRIASVFVVAFLETCLSHCVDADVVLPSLLQSKCLYNSLIFFKERIQCRQVH